MYSDIEKINYKPDANLVLEMQQDSEAITDAHKDYSLISRALRDAFLISFFGIYESLLSVQRLNRLYLNQQEVNVFLSTVRVSSQVGKSETFNLAGILLSKKIKFSQTSYRLRVPTPYDSKVVNFILLLLALGAELGMFLYDTVNSQGNELETIGILNRHFFYFFALILNFFCSFFINQLPYLRIERQLGVIDGVDDARAEELRILINKLKRNDRLMLRTIAFEGDRVNLLVVLHQCYRDRRYITTEGMRADFEVLIKTLQ